jgi:hypothetical protein
LRPTENFLFFFHFFFFSCGERCRWWGEDANASNLHNVLLVMVAKSGDRRGCFNKTSKKKKIIFDFFKSSGKTQTSEAKQLATKEKMKIAHQMFSRGRALLFALRDVDEDFIVGA